MKKGRLMLIAAYIMAITLFTTYVVLDTFVFTKVYSVEEEDYLASDDSTGKSSTLEEGIKVEVTENRQYETTVYVVDVQLSDPSYLKTAFAEKTYGKNITEKTSEMAEENNAVLAVNGDYYGVREKGYVIRNGKLYRSDSAEGQEDVVIYEDGSMDIINESDVSAESLLKDGVVQLLSFGPGLIEEGEISVDYGEEVDRAQSSNPRTAIGIIDELHYVFVVADGRTSESSGLSLYQLAEVMKELGAETAYNLDGGGSSTLWYDGQIVNSPTTNGGRVEERSVSDIVYIGY